MKYFIRMLASFTMTAAIVTTAASQGLYWESIIHRTGTTDTSASKSYYMPKMFKVSGACWNKHADLAALFSYTADSPAPDPNPVAVPSITR